MTKDKEMRRQLDEVGRRINEDPEGLKAEIDTRLVERFGQEWVDANRAYMDAEWPLVVQLFG